MKLVSMKREAQEYSSPDPLSEYGYGLRLSLSDEQCEALGITSPIKPGTQITLQAIAVVVSSTEVLDSDEDGATDVCMSLQITDLGLGGAMTSAKASTLLYGDS